MSEDMNLEAAYTLSERGGEPEKDTHQRRREISELIEVVVLAIVAVATAWSVYQAARFEGRQAFLYSESTRLRIEADESITLGGQQRLLDAHTATDRAAPTRGKKPVGSQVCNHATGAVGDDVFPGVGSMGAEDCEQPVLAHLGESEPVRLQFRSRERSREILKLAQSLGGCLVT